MQLLADVCFTTEGLGVIGVMMSGLVGALAVLWRTMLHAKDQQIADLTAERNRLARIAVWWETVATNAKPPQQPPGGWPGGASTTG